MLWKCWDQIKSRFFAKGWKQMGLLSCIKKPWFSHLVHQYNEHFSILSLFGTPCIIRFIIEWTCIQQHTHIEEHNWMRVTRWVQIYHYKKNNALQSSIHRCRYLLTRVRSIINLIIANQLVSISVYWILFQ